MYRWKNLWPMVIGLILLPILLLYQNCSSQMDSSGTSTNSSRSGGDPIAGKAFFENDLLPILENNCSSCHNQPRFGGRAPLTIFDHGIAINWLANGRSSSDNYLINSAMGNDHDGGNQCIAGINSPPCKQIREWYTIQFGGSDSGGGDDSGIGRISFFSDQGRVKGWAIDPDDDARRVSVRVFIGGKAGAGGTDIGTFQANLFGLGGTYANHYFDFQVPPEFANGQAYDMYVYVDETTDAQLIAGGPRNFTAYTPTSAGMAYFQGTVSNSLNCGSCHTWDYATAYSSLLSPSPADGGTATTNNFYRYSSGANGHPGGNVCGGNLCNNIVEWWNREFN